MAHRHQQQSFRDAVWDYCIAPDIEHDARAHGNIVRHSRCACGAERWSEINGGMTVRSAWYEPEVHTHDDRG